MISLEVRDHLTQALKLDLIGPESESGVEESIGRKKKKPRPYRWPDKIRDEVIARLLKLNAERAEQERLRAIVKERAEKSVDKSRAKKKPLERTDNVVPVQQDLIESARGDTLA